MKSMLAVTCVAIALVSSGAEGQSGFGLAYLERLPEDEC
jgi:hypothetical protein